MQKTPHLIQNVANAENITILNPVNRQDFKPNFNSHIQVKEQNNIENYFSQHIAAIENFALGKFFWFIANPVKGIVENAGGMLQEMIGISIAEFEHAPPIVLFSKTHPEDLTKMFSFTNYWLNLFNNIPLDNRLHLHPTIYLRLKNNEGLYKWTMVQYLHQHIDDKGSILYGLTLVTDISHIKTEGPAMMSILDSHNETCQHFYCSNGEQVEKSKIIIPNLTKREIEILKQLALGHSSKQIAAHLTIAVKTVDNHRQKMLEKVNAKSSAELVSFGINAGYI